MQQISNSICKVKILDTYIYIYYDKPVSERTVWQFVDANYPLNAGRLKLYTDALDEAISQGEKMFESSIFGTGDDKAELATALYNARSARIDASLENIELMETARTGLLAAISNLQEGNYTIWISGSSFNTENAFTVALNQTSLNSSEDAEAMFIIRNSEKTGCVLTIKQNNVCISYYSYMIILSVMYSFCISSVHKSACGDEGASASRQGCTLQRRHKSLHCSVHAHSGGNTG